MINSSTCTLIPPRTLSISLLVNLGIALLDGEVAVPEGYTLLNEGWNPLGENLIYKVGDKNDVDGSEWNLYSGNSWSGVSAAAKDGADGQKTVSVYVINTAAQAWGLQLEKVFGNLEVESSINIILSIQLMEQKIHGKKRQ